MSDTSDRQLGHDKVLHQNAVEDVVEETAAQQLEDFSDEAAIADASAVGGTYSQSEVNAIVTKLNKVLGVLRDSGLIPT